MKAMVLCAGFGTRLGDLTREMPKPMLPVAGRPLLAYLLGHLRDHGFGEVMINLHFRPELIRGVFGDGAPWDLKLAYSPEEQLLGTAGGVKKAEAFFRGDDCFLVQYGDVLTDQDLGALVRRHRQTGALATLLVHQRARSNSVVSLDDEGRVVGFLERPAESERRGVDSPWVNSGICVCSPEILDWIPDGVPCDLPRDVFRKLVDTRRLFSVGLSGFRCAIDSPERLNLAREAVTNGSCRVRPLPVEAAS
jgi:NDP-sugar pyrophosphorylase family protein